LGVAADWETGGAKSFASTDARAMTKYIHAGAAIFQQAQIDQTK